MRVAERAEETAFLTGSPANRAAAGARPWPQRSVASSRKFTPFATEIVPKWEGELVGPVPPRLPCLHRFSDSMRPEWLPAERPYAWHDDGFPVDAAHDFGALRQDFFAHRDRLPQTGQVHHPHVLRRLLPARAPARCGVDQTWFAAR